MMPLPSPNIPPSLPPPLVHSRQHRSHLDWRERERERDQLKINRGNWMERERANESFFHRRVRTEELFGSFPSLSLSLSHGRYLKRKKCLNYEGRETFLIFLGDSRGAAELIFFFFQTSFLSRKRKERHTHTKNFCPLVLCFKAR